MSMPMHITPIPKEPDEFTIDEPLFLKLSLSKSNSTVPKAMIKTRTSIKKTPNLMKVPLPNMNRKFTKVKPKMYKSPTPYAEDYNN